MNHARKTVRTGHADQPGNPGQLVPGDADYRSLCEHLSSFEEAALCCGILGEIHDADKQQLHPQLLGHKALIFFLFRKNAFRGYGFVYSPRNLNFPNY